MLEPFASTLRTPARLCTVLFVLALLVCACDRGSGRDDGASVPATVSAPATTSTAAPTPAVEPVPAPDAAPVARWGEVDGVRYLERVLGGAGFDDRLPMYVMIHGRGDKPNVEYVSDFGPKLRVIQPQAATPSGEGYSWFEYRSNGQAPAELAAGIAAASDALAAAVGTLAQRLPTKGRVVVGGFSQGGMLSYALALRSPALFERALPMSGLLPEPLWPERPTSGVRYPPIRAGHGTADLIVPFAPARALVTALKTRGFDAELVEYPGVRHNVSPAMLERLYAELGTCAAELNALP